MDDNKGPQGLVIYIYPYEAIFACAHGHVTCFYVGLGRTRIGKIPPESFGGWPVLGSLPVKAGSDTPPKNSQRCGDSSGFETGRMMSWVQYTLIHPQI